jgi:integrase
MNTTFNLWLNNKPNRDGTFTIFIRVTQNRKHKLIKSGVSVNNASAFNPIAKPGGWIRGYNEKSKKANETLKKKLKDISEINNDLDNPSTEKIIESYSGNVHGDCLEYLKKIMHRLEKEGKVRSYKRYNQLFNKLAEYTKSDKLPFDQITVTFLIDFKAHLSGLHQNTIYEHFKNLRALFNAAIKEDIIQPEKNPFVRFEVSQAATTKQSLNDDELNRLKELNLEVGSKLWHSRNYFFFSFYNGGIRAGDIITMKWNAVANDRLSYVMAKTRNNKLIKKSVPLLAEAKAILSHYRNDECKPNQFIFGLIKDEFSSLINDEKKIKSGHEKTLFGAIGSRNAILNKNLKELAKLAEISKPLTFHIARHSFADYAISKKVNPRVLQKILGHEKFETTETYIHNRDNKEVDESMIEIFES